jgi:hypothetical protein
MKNKLKMSLAIVSTLTGFSPAFAQIGGSAGPGNSITQTSQGCGYQLLGSAVGVPEDAALRIVCPAPADPIYISYKYHDSKGNPLFQDATLDVGGTNLGNNPIRGFPWQQIPLGTGVKLNLTDFFRDNRINSSSNVYTANKLECGGNDCPVYAPVDQQDIWEDITLQQGNILLTVTHTKKFSQQMPYGHIGSFDGETSFSITSPQVQ